MHEFSICQNAVFGELQLGPSTETHRHEFLGTEQIQVEGFSVSCSGVRPFTVDILRNHNGFATSQDQCWSSPFLLPACVGVPPIALFSGLGFAPKTVPG